MGKWDNHLGDVEVVIQHSIRSSGGSKEYELLKDSFVLYKSRCLLRIGYSRTTAREREVGNAGPPAWTLIGDIVVDIPKGTIVDRVDYLCPCPEIQHSSCERPSVHKKDVNQS